MGLMKCRECGKEVSSKAEICPHCGNTIKKKLTSVDQLGYGCLMVVIIVAVIALIGYFADKFMK